MAVDLVPDIAAFLKECLCAAVAAAANPPQHCCYRLPGAVPQDASITSDLCCEGLAYVQAGDMWISANSFPEQDIIRQSTSTCALPSWGVDLRIGIMRCAPVGDQNAWPTCEEYETAYTQNLVDAQSLRIAACCFRNGYQSIDPQLVGMSVIIGRQVASSVQGGCIERYVPLQVQIPASCDGC